MTCKVGSMDNSTMASVLQCLYTPYDSMYEENLIASSSVVHNTDIEIYILAISIIRGMYTNVESSLH